MTRLIMLGTGHAMVTKCYNTCFIIENDNGALLVDAGGGNGILSQVERAGIAWNNIKALFITHAHTDHILGCIWVIRKINSMIKNGKYMGDFNVYGLDMGIEFLKNSCITLLSDSLSDRIHFMKVNDDYEFVENQMKFKVFDIHSTKMEQVGFRVNMGECSLACLGDEPFNELCASYVEGADWILHEAFCLNKDSDRFKPYEKHHSTALDARKVAAGLMAKHLVLYHTEDTDLENRKAKYTEEARVNYSGEIYVPDDLEVIEIK